MDLKPLSSSITKSGKSHDALFHNSIKQEDEDCKIANVLDNTRQKKETRVGFENGNGRGKEATTFDLEDMEQILSLQEKEQNKGDDPIFIETDDYDGISQFLSNKNIAVYSNCSSSIDQLRQAIKNLVDRSKTYKIPFCKQNWDSSEKAFLCKFLFLMRLHLNNNNIPNHVVPMTIEEFLSHYESTNKIMAFTLEEIGEFVDMKKGESNEIYRGVTLEQLGDVWKQLRLRNNQLPNTMKLSQLPNFKDVSNHRYLICKSILILRNLLHKNGSNYKISSISSRHPTVVSQPTESKKRSVDSFELQAHYFSQDVMDSMKKTCNDSSPVVNREKEFLNILSYVPIVGLWTNNCPDYLSFFHDCEDKFYDSKTPLTMIDDLVKSGSMSNADFENLESNTNTDFENLGNNSNTIIERPNPQRAQHSTLDNNSMSLLIKPVGTYPATSLEVDNESTMTDGSFWKKDVKNVSVTTVSIFFFG